MRCAFRAGLSALVLSLSCAATGHAAIDIRVDKSTQQMTVVQDGRTLYRWPVSTGKRGYATPAGEFQAFRLEKDHFSREWDDAPMPHSIFFTRKGHAIHGSLEVTKLGMPASHGCVRLAPEHAAILFRLVQDDGVLNTKVSIHGAEPPLAPAAVARRAPQRQPQDALDRQAYSARETQRPQPAPQPRYAPQQRYAYEDAPPPSYYRRPQVYGQPYYAQPRYAQPRYVQPYYAQPYRAQPQFRDPYYDSPPLYYRRGYGWD